MHDGKRRLKWQGEDVLAFLRTDFPQAFRDGWDYTVEHLTTRQAIVRLHAHDSQLRPGGTIAGPTMMHLADFAFYVLLLALHGASARLSVTTNLSISFLRKPVAGDLVARVEMLKHGRTLSVGAVHMEDAEGRVVAHAEATYHMGAAEW
ncbi:PaaI family thioesterase [Rhodoligotrophos defluvii]|uniref:PaaI family thioesterase n=1 Tax=Rhodoligotrophos defluvii TaxID=2561934 RepID=UPI0010C97A79|nr:PaaI family thioesterase [Rhodoligotrophos defluvii]